jgi:hypothetical protein
MLSSHFLAEEGAGIVVITLQRGVEAANDTLQVQAIPLQLEPIFTRDGARGDGDVPGVDLRPRMIEVAQRISTKRSASAVTAAIAMTVDNGRVFV